MAACHRAWSSVAAWPRGGSLCGQQVTWRLQARSSPWGPVNYLPWTPAVSVSLTGHSERLSGCVGLPPAVRAWGGWHVL